MLSIKNLYKSYQYAGLRQNVLEGVDFEMDAASSIALLGESGSGKSTLLHLVAGLDRPDSGEILFAGHRVHAEPEAALAAMRRAQLSLVFQQFHLISTLSIIDNIRFQAALCQRLDARYEHELIERLGLGAQLDKYPSQLSRGQQQRVAIARSLLHKPQLVLADEPTGNLDEASSLEVMGLFSELVKRAGSSLLMVTHSKAMAAFMDRRVNLHNGRLAEIE
ncbi:MAG: ABC transporter ATP-binding protein [Gammaproteobacteria bacterium]|nr:ABC transporter ATP-binding protein [Gammaproteobacteria bacterium]MDH3448759.1 ABC transporter ATP-binding protein [Gammaproteobacteria bacterium]